MTSEDKSRQNRRVQYKPRQGNHKTRQDTAYGKARTYTSEKQVRGSPSEHKTRAIEDYNKVKNKNDNKSNKNKI
jgi:hypothetical protein